MFTLIELLVVIAILASLLLPALQEAKQEALKVECMGRLKQIAVAYYIYKDDHEGWVWVFNSGMRPQASYGLTTSPAKGPPIDQGTLDLFDASIRYCPALEPYSYEDTEPKILPRHIYNGANYFQWGYYNAMMDQEVVARVFEAGNRVQVYKSVWTGNRYDYCRPFREDNWSGNSATRTGYSAKYTGGTYFQTYDTIPITSDLLSTSVISHKRSKPKVDDVSIPFYSTFPGSSICRGTNSLWADGHVEWHRYRNVVSYSDTIAARFYSEGYGTNNHMQQILQRSGVNTPKKSDSNT
jgi:prepilin-type N-terminal cleavage/methylation domain-containing protein/prepilin-type processing-associated H-X9-DG protein